MQPDDLIRELSSRVGAGGVSRAEPDRIAYSGDMWPRLQIWKTRGEIMRHPPDAVVWPRTVEQVQAVMRLCDERGVPVIPYGAGSGVCGGTLPLYGGVVMDLRNLDTIYSIDGDAMMVDTGTGVIGHHLEKALSERGFTMGHVPSSILCSTVGGYLAARSAGQLSSKYGKIEDMVVGIEVVLPDGQILRTGELGVVDGGIDWTPVFVGSEGTLGVITRALLRIHRAPEERVFRGLRFRSLRDGIDGMRRVMQAGLTPAVFRLYDPFDSLIASRKKTETSNAEGYGADVLLSLLRPAEQKGERPDAVRRLEAAIRGRLSPLVDRLRHSALQGALTHPGLCNRIGDLIPAGCRLIVGFEGRSTQVRAGMREALAILQECGGEDQGEAPGEHWFEHRYDVSFKQSKVFYAGAFNDTMEVAVPWSRVALVYDAVRRVVAEHGFIMAHFSHAYPEGCSIYFTFAGYRPTPDESEGLYDRIWADALKEASAQGATISHHHGIGLSKRAFMGEEHGEGERIFAALKRTFDPNGIMNPGKVYAGRYGRGRQVGTAL